MDGPESGLEPCRSMDGTGHCGSVIGIAPASRLAMGPSISGVAAHDVPTVGTDAIDVPTVGT